MSIYSTYVDCVRCLYFQTNTEISTIDIAHTITDFHNVKYEFSWSIDNSTWSTFTEDKDIFLTELQAFLDDYEGIIVWLKIQLTITANSSNVLTFSEFTLESVKFNDIPATVLSIEMVNNSSKILNNSKTKNILQPYRNSEPQKQLYDKLSRTVSDIFGFDVIWFKTVPQEDTKNVTFKTYKLSNVVDFKTIKVVINNNEIPDNRLRFSEFDIDFQDEIEIHIVKDVFDESFKDMEPNSNDYLWLPLTNRMYQVNTVYEERTFMNHAAYYNAKLTKFEQRASVKGSIDSELELEDLIDYDYEQDIELQLEEKANAKKSFNDTKTTDIREISVQKSKKLSEFVKFVFNYSKIANNQLAKEYSISDEVSNIWSVQFWFSIDTLEDKKIFQLTNQFDNHVIKLSCSENNFVVDYSSALINRFIELTPVENDFELQATKMYGVILNYAFIAGTRLITCTIVDDEFITCYEQAVDIIETLSQPVNLRVYGHQSIANIRLGKEFVERVNIVRELSTLLPNPKHYYIIDNATPELSEPQ